VSGPGQPPGDGARSGEGDAATEPGPLHLFEGFGVEIELMIVDSSTLDVTPVTDRLIASVAGEPVSEIERGSINWSNELVLHVIELKTNGPATTLDGLSDLFQASVDDANERLRELDAALLPTGAHPWMDPATETRIWPHEHNPVYALYDRIFGCHGHGWSNLQSTHLNLPFHGDEEFGRLHAAVRLVLPLIPALAASSPYLDGRWAGHHDARLEAYRFNQVAVPSLIGSVIPERAFTQERYEDLVFGPIRAAIRPHDTEGVLDHHFLNSRGAIARFDRSAIEIRLIDAQEAPVADLAIVELLVATLRAIADERWLRLGDQQALDERELVPTLLATITHAELAEVEDRRLLDAFGIRSATTAGRVWWQVAEAVGGLLSPDAAQVVERLLARGTLATSLVSALGQTPARDALHAAYAGLRDCLAEGRLYG
jgi:carboxylate-amine ligase